MTTVVEHFPRPVRVIEHCWIPLADGTRLAAKIWLPQDADAFLARCREAYGLAIAGLMCLPPVDEPPAPHFALTAQIARRYGLRLLSMGMSADFETAIAFGATHVRVGTAVFGARASTA